MGKFVALIGITILALVTIFYMYNIHKPVPYQSAISQITQAPTATPSSNVNNLQPKTNEDWVSTLSAVAISATQATINTAKGDIIIQLYPNDTPKTVMNFATLSKYGYYHNLTFHRVVPGFVIQGGDPNGNGTGGVSIYGPTFADELNPNTASYLNGYKEGVVAMANRGPNTNGSQFFIMLADDPTLPHQYTIFGKVISGMDVVKKIAIGDKILTININ